VGKTQTPTSTLTVITDGLGQLVTAFPGRLGRLQMSLRPRKTQSMRAPQGVRIDTSTKDDDIRILKITKSMLDGGRVYFLHWYTPEDFHDIFGVLVDDKAIVFFSLERGADESLPFDVEIVSVHDYRKDRRTSKSARRDLDIVLAFVRSELDKIDAKP